MTHEELKAEFEALLLGAPVYDEASFEKALNLAMEIAEDWAREAVARYRGFSPHC